LVTSLIFVRCLRLIARKLAVLFSFNRGIRPFYSACCFNELSRGSVLYLINASFGTAISQPHNLNFLLQIDDHGVRRGNTGQILAQLRCPAASRVALDLPYWAMRSAPYRLIRMANRMACKAGACFFVVNFMSCITVAKRPWYG
jgi:hypothetical protein